MGKFILEINKYEYIELLSDDFEKILRYDRHTIIYKNIKNNLKYVLFNDFIIYSLTALQTSLNMLLSNQLKLNEFLKMDLGYLCNENFWGDQSKIIYDEEKGEKYWIGEKYLLWPASNRCFRNTWLYQKNSSNFLEVTSFFNWNPDIPEEEEQKNYEKFLKNYKPLVITEISKETAKEWLEKTEKLIAQIEANDSRYLQKN